MRRLWAGMTWSGLEAIGPVRPASQAPPLEYGREVRRQAVHHLALRQRSAELALQARDAAAADAAGHDQVEGGEVGRDVEGEAVRGDPARDAHADGADLLVPEPGAGEAGHAARREAVVRAGADHHFLEVAHVAVHVAPVGGEIEDRVADHLAGAVVGDVAAAAGLEHLEAALAQRLGGEEHVLRARVAPEREDRVVLEQQQLVRDAPGLPFGDQALLDLQPASVGDSPEPPDDQGCHKDVSSNSCSVFLTWAMKRSASAPSTRRWSNVSAT